MKVSGEKVLTFLKKNAVYFILAFCILAIGLSAMFAIIFEDKKLGDANEGDLSGPVEDVDTPDPPVNNDPPVDDKPVITEINFIMPVNNVKAIAEFSEKMVYNSTLSRYNMHKAVDFFADEGASVYAVYDGTVESVTNSITKGYTVTIDHGNGLKTVYNSLADGDIKEGTVVKQGDVIGEVSTTNRQEYKSGPHLHFEVHKDGAVINPEEYLDFGNK